jgi:hypothetical protein
MNWYAAHMIQYFKYRQGRQRSFLVWENIVLIRASNSDEAYAKAEKMGREEEAIDDPSLRIGGHPAKMVFAGVRKVVECLDCDRRPGDGTEVSYTEMELRSEAAIRSLVAGDSVGVTIADTFLEEEPEESKVKPRRAV